MQYKIVLFSLLLSINLFSSQCKMDLILVNSGMKNAIDYELKKNYKYAIIELGEAITYTKQAIDDCQDILSNEEIERLHKHLESFSEHRDRLKIGLR